MLKPAFGVTGGGSARCTPGGLVPGKYTAAVQVFDRAVLRALRVGDVDLESGGRETRKIDVSMQIQYCGVLGMGARSSETHALP